MVAAARVSLTIIHLPCVATGFPFSPPSSSSLHGAIIFSLVVPVDNDRWDLFGGDAFIGMARWPSLVVMAKGVRQRAF